jgi:MoaA/NifB/PqqE/SkfB family radical SAM enzyme
MAKRDIYSAFNAIPWKLIRAKDICLDRRIRPLHIRIMPTNKCNANCQWCCYKDVDRQVELDIKEIKKIIDHFYVLGTRAITFSGGGEPTMHPDIEEMLLYAKNKGIECGLITNGLLWSAKKDNFKTLNKILTWIRVSVVDTVGSYNANIITNIAKKFKGVDIGVSFVVTKGVNLETAKNICEMANNYYNITHIKFIQDSYELGDDSLKTVKSVCDEITDKAFFIWRTEFTKGSKNCHVSLLKPVVDATGYIFPCCDTQHAVGIDTRHPSDRLKMCRWEDFGTAPHFNGAVCKKCYYDTYNLFLSELLNRGHHDEFL